MGRRRRIQDAASAATYIANVAKAAGMSDLGADDVDRLYASYEAPTTGADRLQRAFLAMTRDVAESCCIEAQFSTSRRVAPSSAAAGNGKAAHSADAAHGNHATAPVLTPEARHTRRAIHMIEAAAATRAGARPGGARATGPRRRVAFRA